MFSKVAMSKRVVVPLIKAPAHPTPKKGKLQPMPAIVKPVLPPIQHERRLMDSALGVRPPTTPPDEAPVEVSHLPLHSVESMKNFEAALEDDPATSRSSAVLTILPELQRADPLPALEQIMICTRSWNTDTVIELDFRVYHLLTQSLFTLIHELYQANDMSIVLFKALAICVKIIPASDRAPLQIVVRLLYKMSQMAQFDNLFIKCYTIKPLIYLAFNQFGEISQFAAAILRHISLLPENAQEIIKCHVEKLICQTLNTDIRRDRFTSDSSLYIYQIIMLFTNIYQQLENTKVICRYSLPKYMLDISTLYATDQGLHAAIAKALSFMMMDKDCVEVIEDEDLTPLFMLAQSDVEKIVSSALLALSNAMQISELFVDSVVSISPPLGVNLLCDKIEIKSCQLSAIRCLSKATESKSAADITMMFTQKITPILETNLPEIDEFGEDWTDQKMLVANTLIIFTNLAKYYPEKIALLFKGKMKHLMNFSILDYVLELMKVLLKDPTGKEVCREVKGIDEVQFILGDL